MGSKSRAKRQKNNPSPAKNQNVQPREPKMTVPASLAGGIYSPVSNAFQSARALSKATVMDIQTDYVRSDIFRISLQLVVVILIVIAAFLIGEQTGYLASAGSELSRFFQL